MNFSVCKKPVTRAVILLSLSILGAVSAWPVRALDAAAAPQSAGIYRVALYVDGKLSAREAAVEGRSSRQLRMTMLRNVSASEIADILAQGLSATASDEELSKLVPALFGLGEILGEQKTLLAGEAFQLDWAAATGTTVSIQSDVQRKAASQSFDEIGMFAVMSRMWLRRSAGGDHGS